MLTPELPHEPLARLARRIEAETGLQFDAARGRDLESGVRRIAQARGIGAAAAVDWLLAGPWDAARTDLCARHLTIGETYFFREPRGLELLCDQARRKLASGAPLRVWSAGCCTGEEPYSMAMALRAALPRHDPEQVSILATDLNEASLAFARAAVYREWSFRRTPPAMRAAWFTPAGPGVYALRREIREQVRFARLNLAAAGYPSAAGATQAMDVIFCRNVLMYFSKSQMKAAIGRLRECLVDGGWLVVNPTEASAELFEGFRAHCWPDAILYQKVAAAPAPRDHAAPPARRAVPAPAPKRCGATPLEVPKPACGLARAGSSPDAQQLLPDGAGGNPLAPEPYQAAAQLALERGDHAAARRHLQRQLYLEPDSILAHYLNGVAHLGMGRRAAALRAFEASASLLYGVADEAPVPGADGWRAAGLRAALRAWMERAA